MTRDITLFMIICIKDDVLMYKSNKLSVLFCSVI